MLLIWPWVKSRVPGVGSVYRAQRIQDTSEMRDVAVKVLPEPICLIGLAHRNPSP
jgi:hypothetical protein